LKKEIISRIRKEYKRIKQKKEKIEKEEEKKGV
jgi:hypothetical protein